jgi:hypothetical protein
MKYLNAAVIGLGAALAFNTAASAHGFNVHRGIHHDNKGLSLPGWNNGCGGTYCPPGPGAADAPPNALNEYLEGLRHKYLGNKSLSYRHHRLILTIPF